MFERHFPSVLVAVVVTGWCCPPASAQPAEKEAGTPRPPLTAEHQKWVAGGQDKLTEGDLIARLGPPDAVANPIDPDSAANPVADIMMVWQDITAIEVIFKGGKAKQISGRFSPRLKSEQITLENFRKLKSGAGRSDVEQVLGSADSNEELGKGTFRYEWKAQRVLKVYFKGGKVTGVGWVEEG